MEAGWSSSRRQLVITVRSQVLPDLGQLAIQTKPGARIRVVSATDGADNARAGAAAAGGLRRGAAPVFALAASSSATCASTWSASSSSRNGWYGRRTRSIGTCRAIAATTRKCAGRCPMARSTRLRWVCSHSSPKASLCDTGAVRMPAWWLGFSTMAAHTGNASVQALDASTQNFSTPGRTLDRTLSDMRICSSVCFHKRRLANDGSAVTRPPRKASPETSSASRAWPRSIRAAASVDLPSPLRPISSTAPAVVRTAAAYSGTTPRCCSRTVHSPARRLAMSAWSPPRGSMRTSRPSAIR